MNSFRRVPAISADYYPETSVGEVLIYPPTPEKRLLLEIIFQAFRDYHHFWARGACGCTERKDALLAQKWLMSSSTEDFSFLWCCEQVFRDPSHMAHLVRIQCAVSIPKEHEIANVAFSKAKGSFSVSKYRIPPHNMDIAEQSFGR